MPVTISEVVHIANTPVLDLIFRHVARLFNHCALESLISTINLTVLMQLGTSFRFARSDVIRRQ